MRILNNVIARSEATKQSMPYRLLVILTFLFATSAFAWPWSGSGESKVSAEDQARIKDSLQTV